MSGSVLRAMSEIVEYALVALVSTLFVAGSVATYGSFSSFAAGLEFRAEFLAVSSMASQALANGSSTATVTIPASTFTCRSGTLTVASGQFSEGVNVRMSCDFALTEAQGRHTLEFSVRSSQLVLAVT